VALKLIELSQRAGDEQIGQTLVRLAGLAASVHAFEVAVEPADAAARLDGGANGLARRSVVLPSPSPARASVCREAGR
jgi:hypothetical protein